MTPSRPATSYTSISAEALLSLDSMEGVYSLPVVETAPPKPPARKPQVLWPGYALACAVAAVAYAIHYLPVAPFRVASASGVRYPVSAAIVAILSGVTLRSLLPIPQAIADTFKHLARRTIPLTIALTGAGLNLASIASVGITAFTITVLCILVAAPAAIWLGRLLGVWRKTAVLIGAGTAICGTSAIVAVAPLIEAEDQDVMLSIGTVNILGLVLMFAFPLIGAFLKLSDEAFGVWAGTSIHAVPQVVAAAFAFSRQAGALATLVKLVRVALLAPFMFGLGIWYARQHHSNQPRIHYARLVPGFVWGFMGLALLNTVSLLPTLQFRFGSVALSELLANLGELLLTLSMAAMGLEVNIRFFAKVGGRAILVGIGASIILCSFSLILIRLLL